MTTPLTPYAIGKALKTEKTDSLMKLIVENDELATQVYFNSFDDMNRIYPYIEDIPLVYGPSLDVQSFNFYFLADEIHNSERELVWTPPYLDPAGQGWIISCLSPIYRGDFLEGVIGLDVPLEMLEKQALSAVHLKESSILLVDQSGLIVAMNENAETFISLEEVSQDEYTVVEKNILKPESYNIFSFDNMQMRDLLVHIYQNDPKEINLNKQNYYVTKDSIETMSWEFITITSTAIVKKDINSINRSVNINMLIILISIFIIVAIVLFVYKQKIIKMAKVVSDPLEKMAVNAKSFGIEGDFISNAESSGILEIDLLNRELYLMSKEIVNRKDRLIAVQIENKKAEVTIETYHKEAITDNLTQVYNRRKIDDVLDAEVKRSKRYRNTFSILLLDIDYFKEINDKYGHQVGDEILKGVAKILKNSVRHSDVVSRWGGDEFLIVIIEANEAEAAIIAEKIRNAIEFGVFDHDIKTTTSIGVAEYDFKQNDARDLLRKADIALYEAKNEGRNKVVKYNRIGANDE
jgi:diguanylate cyclase (GGDEF)-like protein